MRAACTMQGLAAHLELASLSRCTCCCRWWTRAAAAALQGCASPVHQEHTCHRTCAMLAGSRWTRAAACSLTQARLQVNRFCTSSLLAQARSLGLLPVLPASAAQRGSPAEPPQPSMPQSSSPLHSAAQHSMHGQTAHAQPRQLHKEPAVQRALEAPAAPQSAPAAPVLQGSKGPLQPWPRSAACVSAAPVQPSAAAQQTSRAEPCAWPAEPESGSHAQPGSTHASQQQRAAPVAQPGDSEAAQQQGAALLVQQPSSPDPPRDPAEQLAGPPTQPGSEMMQQMASSNALMNPAEQLAGPPAQPGSSMAQQRPSPAPFRDPAEQPAGPPAQPGSGRPVQEQAAEASTQLPTPAELPGQPAGLHAADRPMRLSDWVAAKQRELQRVSPSWTPSSPRPAPLVKLRGDQQARSRLRRRPRQAWACAGRLGGARAAQVCMHRG